MMMSRLSLIRFGTYAVLLVTIFFARQQRYFIPLYIPLHGFPIPQDYHHGGYSPTGLPGFADTALSGSAILHLAQERIARDGISADLLDYDHPSIELQPVGARLLWTVSWRVKQTREKNAKLPNTLWLKVVVDDRSRETTVEHYDANLKKIV